MSVDCDPNALMQAAKCFSCIPKGSQEEVMVYLLAQIAGGSTDPATLMQQAKCFKCIPKGELEEVMAYLLCQVSLNTGMLSGAGSPIDTGTVPSFIGQLYHDTTWNAYWRSTGTTSADWVIANPTFITTGITPVDDAGGFSLFGAVPGDPVTSILCTATHILIGITSVGHPSSLVSFDAPYLVTLASLVGGGVTMTGFSFWTTMTVPKWLPTNGRSYNLSANKFTAATVNHILARGVANPAFVSGTLNLAGGAGTNAAPTGQGILDKATLIGRGVTVTTN